MVTICISGFVLSMVLAMLVSIAACRSGAQEDQYRAYLLASQSGIKAARNGQKFSSDAAGPRGEDEHRIDFRPEAVLKT
jgi:hypothetical protein